MEQSGRNQWQSAANGWGRKRLKQAQTVAVVCDQLPRPQNGKEGVSGSSPEEGFQEGAGNSPFCSSQP
jgi:hypothetical protein